MVAGFAVEGLIDRENPPTVAAANFRLPGNPTAAAPETGIHAARRQTFSALEADGSNRSLIAALRAIEAMSNDEIAAALMPLRGETDSAVKWQLLRAWAERDPRAALRFVLSEPELDAQLKDVIIIFQNWVVKDDLGALDAALKLPRNLRGFARKEVLDHMGLENPARTFDILRGMDLGAERPMILTSVFSHWARTDPVGAKGAIGELKTPGAREEAWRFYIHGLFERSPDAAAREVQAMQAGPDRNNATTALLNRWMEEDLEGALDYMANLDLGAGTDAIMREAGQHAVFEDPQRVFQWALNENRGATRDWILGSAISYLAHNDPVAAAELVTQLPFGETYTEAVSGVAHSWAQHDPGAAWQWANTLPAGREREIALYISSHQFARVDPEGALAYAMNLRDASDRNAFFDAIASHRATVDPRATLDWVATLPPDAVDSARENALAAWARAKPKETAAYFAAQPDVSISSKVGMAIADEWARRDSPGAAAWALTLSEGETRVSAVRVATREWLRQAPYAASAWIAELPASEARDVAVGNIVERIAPSDPASAFSWATSVQRENRRKHWTEQATDAWRERDADAARLAIEASDLPESEKANLLQRL